MTGETTTDTPRVVCTHPDCQTELICTATRAAELAGRWRCAEHDGRWRPGRPPRELWVQLDPRLRGPRRTPGDVPRSSSSGPTGEGET